MVSGYLTARGLTRRLKGLSVAADRWSRGDFSAITHDTSEDELGQTTRQLNTMAEQLQNLFLARQKIATLEERNRLARDLHDSVKQQIFAASMQIGAMRVLLRRDVDAAEVRLNEDEYIFPALRAGALSYVLKDVGPDELAETIRKAARDESVLHPRVAASYRRFAAQNVTRPISLSS